MNPSAILLAAASSLATAAPPPAEPPAPLNTDHLVFTSGKPVLLPPPRTTGGAPLMAALARRQSTRRFKPNGLPLDVLSDLLWAANGTNRPDSGKRTAATARNWQDLDVYVATARGLFRHDVVSHVLVPVQPGDLRAKTGTQPFVGLVPVNLLYVADAAKVPATLGREDLLVYGGTHAGIVAQNVYLFAASAGLGTVLRASIDRPALETAMGLGPKQRVVMAQSVGYPEPEP